jgi:hypothetical protein
MDKIVLIEKGFQFGRRVFDGRKEFLKGIRGFRWVDRVFEEKLLAKVFCGEKGFVERAILRKIVFQWRNGVFKRKEVFGGRVFKGKCFEGERVFEGDEKFSMGGEVFYGKCGFLEEKLMAE